MIYGQNFNFFTASQSTGEISEVSLRAPLENFNDIKGTFLTGRGA